MKRQLSRQKLSNFPVVPFGYLTPRPIQTDMHSSRRHKSTSDFGHDWAQRLPGKTPRQPWDVSLSRPMHLVKLNAGIQQLILNAYACRTPSTTLPA